MEEDPIALAIATRPRATICDPCGILQANRWRKIRSLWQLLRDPGRRSAIPAGSSKQTDGGRSDRFGNCYATQGDDLRSLRDPPSKPMDEDPIALANATRPRATICDPCGILQANRWTKIRSLWQMLRDPGRRSVIPAGSSKQIDGGRSDRFGNCYSVNKRTLVQPASRAIRLIGARGEASDLNRYCIT